MEKFNRGSDRQGGFSGGRSGSPRFGGSPRPDRFTKPFGKPSFGGNKFGGRPSFGGDRAPVSMHDAICNDCGNKCQVPFRPSGEKPVYCNNCFGGKREGGDRPMRKEFNDRPAPQFSAPKIDGTGDMKKQLDTIHLKLDSLIRTVEMMTRLEGSKSSVKAAPVAEKKIVLKVGAKKAKVVAKKKK